MNKFGLMTVLCTVILFNVNTIKLDAEINFSADESHTIMEGSEHLSHNEILELYHVEYDHEDTLSVYSNNVNYNVPGTYQIEFVISDNLDNTETYYSDMVIYDVKPEISLQHEHVQAVGNKPESSYDLLHLFGASASELVTGDLTSDLEIDDSRVVYDQIGHNDVYFTVSDDDGNEVTAIGDLYFRQLAPEITASEVANSTVGTVLNKEQLIELFNVQVIAADGSYNISVNDEAVDYYQVGSYPVKFSVTDIYGNKSEQITSTLNIIENESEFTADDTHSVPEGTEVLKLDEIIELYNVEYDHDNRIWADQSKVDYNTPGTYEITFVETDSSNNSRSIKSEMIVTDVLPTINVQHSNVQALVNDPIDLITTFGVTASESHTGDLNSEIVVDDSQVDYMHIGHYPVYFSVSDNEGNIVTSSGDLYLRSDAPKLVADIQHSVSEGNELSDEEILKLYNVVASDKDGIDFVDVDTSKVNFNKPGRYSISFVGYDIYGMNSNPSNAIIEVTDVLPKITTDNEQITVEIGDDLSLADKIGIHASEISVDDLNQTVIIDDSQVDYNQVGVYKAVISAHDDEGNIVTKEISVEVIDSSINNNSCINNGGHTNNSHNCQDENTTCNNNGSNDCKHENNGSNGNSNGDKNHGKN